MMRRRLQHGWARLARRWYAHAGWYLIAISQSMLLATTGLPTVWQWALLAPGAIVVVLLSRAVRRPPRRRND